MVEIGSSGIVPKGADVFGINAAIHNWIAYYVDESYVSLDNLQTPRPNVWHKLRKNH
jgi:hypothetical protein